MAKIVNTRLAKVFMVIFALAERLPTSATLDKNLIEFRNHLINAVHLLYLQVLRARKPCIGLCYLKKQAVANQGQ